MTAFTSALNVMNAKHKQRSALAWREQINELPTQRSAAAWHYLLLGETELQRGLCVEPPADWN